MKKPENKNQGQTLIKTELCVIGGGVSGLAAAVAAARRGVKVVLINDRPVLGGNASSEVRMWIRGAGTRFPFHREGGIVEELALKNIKYNPTLSYAVWDSVLYDTVTAEKNIRLLLNASCTGAQTRDGKIVSVSAWQLTTYKEITVEADYFADCSGDGVLIDFTGAKYRQRREARAEFNESYAPEKASTGVMGNSCILQARETLRPVPYTAPAFARKFSEKEFIHRFDTTVRDSFKLNNFWWIEIGGERDTLKDAEEIKSELLAAAYGVWDYIKNSGKFDSECWELDWVCQYSGKRESRRYIGEYTLTQNDIENATAFSDEIAYGGWSMDDHNPLGMNTSAPPNIHYPFDRPYPIPFRCLYSKNVKNLLFAGRNISVTHLALSSTRVMGTCAMLGQAVGTAVSIMNQKKQLPNEFDGITALQKALTDDDCYLLNTPRKVSDVIKSAVTNCTDAQKEILFNSNERELNEGDVPYITLKKGETKEFTFKQTFVSKIRLVFDSDFQRKGIRDYYTRQFPLKLNIKLDDENVNMPAELVKSFRLEVLENGKWQTVCSENDNRRRLVYADVFKTIGGIRFTGLETYGSENIRLISLDIVTD